jgi:DNA polymerase-1
VVVEHLADFRPLVLKHCGGLPEGMVDARIINRVLGTNLAGGSPPHLARSITSTINTASPPALARIRADHQLARLLYETGDRGFLIDRHGLTVNLAKQTKTVDEIRSILPFNPRSTERLAGWFVEHGAIVRRSAAGDVCVDKEGIQALLGPDQPAIVRSMADVVQAFRTADTMSQRIRELQRHLTLTDRVHPSIVVAEARSGRMAYSEPALQNLPTQLRPLVLAEPSLVLVACDLAQIELRVVAALSQDPRLIDAINGGDFYRRTAEAIFGPTANTRHRGLAKITVFAILYGGGANAISTSTGLSKDDAAALRDRFLTAHPTLASWMHDVRQRPALETVFGRSIPIDSDDKHAAVNYLVQSTARDLFADQFLAAHEAGLTPWLAMHDEILVLSERGDANSTEAILHSLMTTRFLGVSITAKSGVLGARWA